MKTALHGKRGLMRERGGSNAAPNRTADGRGGASASSACLRLVFVLLLMLLLPACTPSAETDSVSSGTAAETSAQPDPDANPAPPSAPSPTPAPAPTPTPTPEPTPTPKREQIRAHIASMELDEKAAAVFMVRPHEAELLPVGGVVFFSDDIHTAEQVKADIRDFQLASPLPLFIGVDEEGGRVSRLSKLDGFPALAAADTLDMEKADVRQSFLTLGQAMAELGFTVNFAPVADVRTNPKNKVIGDRAFSADADKAAASVAAAVQSLQDGGVLAVPKHFPGHGDTAGDSHTGSVSSSADLERLRAVEFWPFRAAIEAGAEAVMAGHIALPEVTGNKTPASLSREIVTGLLRDELGFEGVVFTDALDMEAITKHYKPGEAAVLALQAGCDVLLMPERLVDAQAGIIDAVLSGRLEESVLDTALERQFYLKW